MHVISRKRLREFSDWHDDARTSLATWYKATRRAAWSSFAEIRELFPHADRVGSCVVFNVGGDTYRLIARIRYARGDFKGRVYVLHVLTHSEYDTGGWKADCDCR